MLPEDIDREFREIRSRLERAKQLVEATQLDEAASEFEFLIELMEVSRPDYEPELMYCIKELGDCYLALHRYTSAASLYLRLHAAQVRSGVADSEQVVTLFKLGKANEKSGREKNADTLYAESLQLAEECLGDGHPLLSNILESYAAFLKTGNKNAKKAAVLLERARDNRDRSSQHVSDHILEALLAGVDEPGGSSRPSKSMSTSKYAHSRAPHQVSDRLAMLRRLRVPVLILAVFSCLGVFLWSTFKRADSVASIKLNLPQAKFSSESFQSADGFKSLKLINEQTAEISFGGAAKKAKLIEGNQLESLFMAKSPTVFSFKQATKTDLQDADGTVLYPETPKAVASARMIADAAGKTYATTNEYPQELDSLAVPANVKDGLQIVYIGREGSSAEVNAARQIANRGLLAKENKPVRDSVHVYYSLSSDNGTSLRATHFFIRPFDGTGECYTSSVAEKAAFLELDSGKDVTFDTISGEMSRSEQEKFDGSDVTVVLPARLE